MYRILPNRRARGVKIQEGGAFITVPKMTIFSLTHSVKERLFKTNKYTANRSNIAQSSHLFSYLKE